MFKVDYIMKGGLKVDDITVQPLKTYKRMPLPIKVAAEFIYQALQEPKSAEVRKALDEMKLLNHSLKTIDLDKLHFEIVHELPLPAMVKFNAITAKKRTPSHEQRGGNPSLKQCILMGLVILLMTIASYMFAAYNDMRTYQNNCADVIAIFDPKRQSASSYYKQFLNFTYMVFNKEHTKHCDMLQKKYGTLAISLANQLHESISSFQARIAISAAIVAGIGSIFSEGIRALVCIAAEFLGKLGPACDQMCKRRSANRRSAPANEEEEGEEDQE
jgi:hypothetical protein